MGVKKKGSAKLAIVLSLAIAATSLLPMNVQAAVKAPAKKVVYMTQKYQKGEYGYADASFRVTGIKKEDYVKISSVKSSNEDVITVSCIYGDYYFDKDQVSRNGCDFSCSATKPGSSTISYKIGKYTKKTKITVKDYENPVKKITLDGVNDGKDFSKLTKNQSSVYAEWDENGNVTPVFSIVPTKNPVLTIEPASGWSVQNIYLSSMGISESIYYYEGKAPKGKQTITLYELTGGSYGTLSMSFINKDGGSMYVSYDLSEYSSYY